MSAVIEFLLARIAEDEAVAQECLKPKNLIPYGDKRIPAIKPEEWGALAENYLGGEMGVHCARHNPLRVLAECKAKQSLIELHSRMDGKWLQKYCQTCAEWEGSEVGEGPPGIEYPCDTLRTLATVYGDHVDYRPEWDADGN